MLACKAARRAEGWEVSAHAVLVLDSWPVQTQAVFQDAVRAKDPWLHLLYVPPNLSGQLQVGMATMAPTTSLPDLHAFCLFIFCTRT